MVSGTTSQHSDSSTTRVRPESLTCPLITNSRSWKRLRLCAHRSTAPPTILRHLSKTVASGRFYVTTTDNDKAALQANNRAALADLAAHEGFPGHDWHYKVMTQYRSEIAGVRWLTPGAVEDSSSMWEDSMAAEGWGLYAEALMAEPQPGAPKGSTRRRNVCINFRASFIATCACASTRAFTPAG